MSEEQHKDELERLLKAAADDYSVPPPPEVWDRVEKTLRPAEGGKRRFLYWLWPAAAIALLIGGYLLFRPSPSPRAGDTAPAGRLASAGDETHGGRNDNTTTSGTATTSRDAASTPLHGTQRTAPPSQQAIHPPSPEIRRGQSAQPASEPVAGSNANAASMATLLRVRRPAYANYNIQPLSPATRPGAAFPAGIPGRERALAGNRFITGQATTHLLQRATYHPAPMEAAAGAPQKKEPGQTMPAPDTAYPASVKKKKIRWELYGAPAASFVRSRIDLPKNPSYSGGSAGNRFNDRLKGDRHPVAGIQAGFQAIIPLKGSWALNAGLAFIQTGYNITTTGRIYETPPDKAAPQNNQVYNFSNNSLRYMAALPQKSVSYRNRYAAVELPVLLQWEHAAGRHLRVQVASGLTLSYLPEKDALIYYPPTGGYFRDADRIRTWNGNFIADASLLAPVTGHWDVKLGPMLHYQLFSTYKNDYPVREHPFAAGLHLGLQWTP